VQKTQFYCCVAHATQKTQVAWQLSTVGVWRYCAWAKMCLPSRCLEADCITPLLHCCMRVFLRNGCFCGSTALVWSKYATVLSSKLCGPQSHSGLSDEKYTSPKKWKKTAASHNDWLITFHNIITSRLDYVKRSIGIRFASCRSSIPLDEFSSDCRAKYASHIYYWLQMGCCTSWYSTGVLCCWPKLKQAKCCYLCPE
jgi:hypothetical protein